MEGIKKKNSQFETDAAILEQMLKKEKFWPLPDVCLKGVSRNTRVGFLKTIKSIKNDTKQIFFSYAKIIVVFLSTESIT